ncbi:unnamed protein product [Prorocentrum cordatum]|uniref:Secreted protein n=1 Tax=Prorocentrum cordatum TaxID=2364126 RepID=A0ABN9PP70_9DINO|nr:unnamed protein product [Polarella glacialis]
MEPLPLLAQPTFCMLMLATTIPKAIGMNGLYLVLRTVAVRPTPTFPNKLFLMLIRFCMLRLATGTVGRFLARCTFAVRTSSSFDAAARLSMAWQANLHAPLRSFHMLIVPFCRSELRMMRMTLRHPPPVIVAQSPILGTLHPVPRRFLPCALRPPPFPPSLRFPRSRLQLMTYVPPRTAYGPMLAARASSVQSAS